MKGRVLTIAATLAFVGAVGCTTGTPGAPRQSFTGGKGTIVVGVSGAFTENHIVAEMYADVLEHAGYTVDRQLDLRSREVSQAALESGQIDLKPEYLTSLLVSRGIDALTPAPAQDTNVFVANTESARRFGLTTMTSLAGQASQLTLGGPPECPQRPFCLTGLKDVYGILFDDFEPLDAGGPQTVEALKSDDVQVALLFSTDPSIEANGFVPLIDDLHLQNAENLTPVIRTEKLNDEVRDVLDAVSARLTTENVTGLVGKVVLEGQDVGSVARDFLIANG